MNENLEILIIGCWFNFVDNDVINRNARIMIFQRLKADWHGDDNIVVAIVEPVEMMEFENSGLITCNEKVEGSGSVERVWSSDRYSGCSLGTSDRYATEQVGCLWERHPWWESSDWDSDGITISITESVVCYHLLPIHRYQQSRLISNLSTLRQLWWFVHNYMNT